MSLHTCVLYYFTVHCVRPQRTFTAPMKTRFPALEKSGIAGKFTIIMLATKEKVMYNVIIILVFGFLGVFQSSLRKETPSVMTKSIKRIWSRVSGVLVGIVVLLTVALVGVRIIGLQPFVVLSGSMEPTYPVGSLIYVKSVDYKQLQVGDAITYMISQDTVVTHRIIEVLADEEDPDTVRYFTQGDANSAPDGTSVHYKNIIGKPVFSIPYLGYVSNYIQNPPGMYVAIAVGAVLILLVFLPDVFADEKKKK